MSQTLASILRLSCPLFLLLPVGVFFFLCFLFLFYSGLVRSSYGNATLGLNGIVTRVISGQDVSIDQPEASRCDDHDQRGGIKTKRGDSKEKEQKKDEEGRLPRFDETLTIKDRKGRSLLARGRKATMKIR